jgi:hypothetical protein
MAEKPLAIDLDHKLSIRTQAHHGNCEDISRILHRDHDRKKCDGVLRKLNPISFGIRYYHGPRSC